MFTILFKIFLYLAFLLGFLLLPLYLFRKNIKEVAVVAVALIIFLVTIRDFLLGKTVCYYDTKNIEYLLLIIKQWLDGNIAIGWNPYMNAGEPLYLFSNNFLWAPWVFFCWVNRIIALDPHILFNIFLVFLYTNFCIGSLLLFLSVFDDFRVAFFCFVSLLMSRMFFVSLGQYAGLYVIYYFPYILFCFLTSLKMKKNFGLGFIIIFLGIAANHYLPHFVVFSTLICVFFLYGFNKAWFKDTIVLLRSNWKLLSVSGLVALLAASSVIFLFLEARRYASPDRDSALISGVRLDYTGLQSQLKASLKGYSILFDKNNITQIQHAFYFGILPLLLVFFAVLYCRDKLFWSLLLSTALILCFGLGFDFWGYRIMIQYVPGFNLMRHSFPFAHFVSLLIICLSGFGLKVIMEKVAIIRFRLKQVYAARFFTPNTVFILALFLLCLDLIPFNWNLNRHVNTLALICEDISFKKYGDKTRGVLVNMGNACIAFNTKPTTPGDIKYPSQRSLFSLKSFPIAPDLSPLVFKKASLLHFDYFLFFRDKRLNDMVEHLFINERTGKALGVESPLISFTQEAIVLPDSTSKDGYIKAVFRDSLSDLSKSQRRAIFLEGDIDFKPEMIGSNNTVPAKIEYKKIDNPNSLEIAVEIPGDGFLLRLENFHPAWQAFIDGARVKIYRANYAFQAIKMPKGTHRVRFNFWTLYPMLFYINIAVVFLAYIAFNIYLYRLRSQGLGSVSK